MRFGLLTMLFVVGCNDATTPHPLLDAGARHDSTIAPPPWWQPQPGTTNNWDIQLAPPFDVFTPRTMYVLSLWDVVPAPTTIDYGDGTPVMVPKGRLSDAMLDLHARRPRTVVICLVDTGALDLTAPDAKKFPGFEANPPDEPVVPKAGSVIGWSATLPASTRWLDVRPAARAAILPLLEKRFDLAKQIGCDGIVGDHNEMYRVVKSDGTGLPGSGTGFDPPLDFEAQGSWYKELATQGHMRELSMGMRGGYEMFSGQLATPVMSGGLDYYDWQIADRCGENTTCDSTKEFRDALRAVLGLDFTTNVDGDPQNVGTTCGGQKGVNGLALDGIVKDVALTSASWFSCPTFVP